MKLIFEAITPESLLQTRRVLLDADTRSVVSGILADIKKDPSRLVHYARRFDGLGPSERLVYGRQDLERAYLSLLPKDQALLDRVHGRIEAFSRAQRACLRDLDIAIPGGRAGHRFEPYRVAGCYAPGGRFPLPSSVIMTVVPAKVAGVERAWVASPRPSVWVRAAAFRSGADALVAIGGAQAVGAMAYGIAPVPACDVIVGPGNRYVTAAKHLVREHVAIDMLAGPSELLVLADHSADPELVAYDLLAQAEHDPDAWPVLLTTAPQLVDKVRNHLQHALSKLDTRDTALQALANGGFVVARSIAQMVGLSEAIAAEHVQLMVQDAQSIASQLSRFGALFIGSASAEVMGDYGAGPNHVLPTGGSAGFRGGLSVLDFMSARTWMQLDDQDPEFANLARDSEALAVHEGLAAHALAARARL